jgi:hypothetical protein
LYGKGKHQVLTGYDGTLLVDPATAELAQLTIRTNGLPLETAACYATSTLNYSRVKLKGVDFLLPSASVLRIAGTNGDVLENHTVFANCHEFLGEATLKFETPDEVTGADATHPKGKKTSTIPAGASFVAGLTSAIDTTTAAAGDPLQAKLMTPIKDGFKVLVPDYATGALPHRPVTVSLAIKLESVEVAGVPLPLKARFLAAPGANQHFSKAEMGTLKTGVELGTLSDMENRSTGFVFRNCAEPCVIQSGLESMWTTLPARGK